MLTLFFVILNLLCAAWNLSYLTPFNAVVGAFNAFVAGFLLCQLLTFDKRDIY